MSRIKESGSDKLFGIINFTIVNIILIIVIFPLIHVVSCSISSPDLVSRGQVILIPRGLTFEGYLRIFREDDLLIGYGNTIMYTVLGTLLNLFLTLPTGYALSKKEMPGRNIFMTYFIITMYFSGGLIPTFLLVKSLGLFNTRTVLILLGGVSVYNVIICRTFFAGIPKELEDAAIIDGCSTYRTFLQIVLPLSKALIGVMVLYYGVGHWNSYFTAMIYVMDNNKKPLQLFLRKILIIEQMNVQMTGEFGEDVSKAALQLKELLKYAVIIVASLPVLVLYPFLQKYFDKGVLIGSIKG